MNNISILIYNKVIVESTSSGRFGSKCSNILGLFNNMTLHRLLQLCFCGVLEVKCGIESVEFATIS